MPEAKTPPVVQDVDLETSPLHLFKEQWKDAEALSLVKQTFNHYETWRQTNHDSRWKMHDMLYFGWSPPKVWQGTSVPRSNLGQPIVFDQIEAAMPQVMNALFNGDEWFDVEAEAGGTLQEARDVKANLLYELTHARGDSGLNATTEIEMAIRSILQYGNGGVHIQYDPVTKSPYIQWVDIRDIYVDPGTPTPHIDESKATVLRRMISVEEIDSWRQNETFNIPEKAILVHMSRNRQNVAADNTKRTQEAARGVSFSPGYDDMLVNPADRLIEVLFYYSKNRMIWTLNREWVAFNEENPYGFIPFAFGFCYLVPSRFYAMSMADVLEGTQLTIQALLNAKLDELHLAIHPPRSVARSGGLTPTQLRWHPGAVQEINKPEDLVIHQPSGATANVSEDIQYLELSAERRTGVGGPSSGQFRPGNVNRTAGGVNAQMQGAASRLQPIVKHIEDYLIVPVLTKFYRMVQYHAEPGQVLPGLAEGQQIQVGAEAFKAPMKFAMKSSSMMLTQAALQQQFPFITQYLLSQPFMEHLTTIGQTVDINELLQMLKDATGTGKKYNFIRPLTQQEQQQRSQPDPKTTMMMQKAQQDAQTRMQLGQLSSQTDLQIAQMESDAAVRIAEENSSLGLLEMMQADGQGQQELQLHAAKGKQELALADMKNKQQLNQSSQLHMLKLKQMHEATAAKAQTDSVKSGISNQVAAQSGQNKLSGESAATLQKHLQTEMAHRQKMRHGEEAHKKELSQIAAITRVRPSPKK